MTVIIVTWSENDHDGNFSIIMIIIIKSPKELSKGVAWAKEEPSKS